MVSGKWFVVSGDGVGDGWAEVGTHVIKNTQSALRKGAVNPDIGRRLLIKRGGGIR